MPLTASSRVARDSEPVEINKDGLPASSAAPSGQIISALLGSNHWSSPLDDADQNHGNRQNEK